MNMVKLLSASAAGAAGNAVNLCKRYAKPPSTLEKQQLGAI
jgi:hypothetical protein